MSVNDAKLLHCPSDRADFWTQIAQTLNMHPAHVGRAARHHRLN
jgi:hypothetical protein